MKVLIENFENFVQLSQGLFHNILLDYFAAKLLSYYVKKCRLLSYTVLPKLLVVNFSINQSPSHGYQQEELRAPLYTNTSMVPGRDSDQEDLWSQP